jgi:DNA polymerase-1
MPETNNGRERLFLLDAMALAYRAHFAMMGRPLITSSGLDTSAVFGFTQSLIKLLDDESPDHIAVVFDPPDGKSFRDALYEEYKANRPPMPEPLREAIPHVKEVVRAFDIPVVEVENMEADDVIGTLARRAESEGVDVVIVSPDKDFRQLLSGHISMMRPAYRGVEFEVATEESFREEYGVDPIRFIDILALLGDSSDNVPGVPGIGAKTAPKLIQEHGSVEALLDKAEEISAKRVREGLLENREAALLSKKLVTIVTDLDLDVDWHDLRQTGPDLDRIGAVFEHLEFRTLLKRVMDKWGSGSTRIDTGIGVKAARSDSTETPKSNVDAERGGQVSMDFGSADQPTEALTVQVGSVRSESELADLAGKLRTSDRYGIQVYCDGPDPMTCTVMGIGFAIAGQDPSYIAFEDSGLDLDRLKEVLRPILTDGMITKIGYDLKSQRIALVRAGLDLAGPLEDAMVAHYVLAPDDEHDLPGIARTMLGLDIPEANLDTVAAGAYVAIDLVDAIHVKLDKDRRALILKEIEYPLIPVLADMELAGVRVNEEALAEISTQLGQEADTLEGEIYELAGEEFSIGSPKQLGEILFDKLGLEPIRKTSTGRRSTNERVLMQLAAEHELPAKILDWRRVTKLKSTYVDTLADYIHPETGRIHGSFNQAVAATGRLSSANPNVQNIPVRTGTGKEIRRAFIPAEGMRFLVADYVQIELRILASMSDDPGLIAAFENREDVHRATAARIYEVDPEDVTRDMRRKAKEVNFGIPYGISAYELSQRLRISREEAKDLINQYDRSYPEVDRLRNHQINHARNHGYVETILGRRRYTPAINSPRFNERSAAERIAMNMPIQGSQADMIKRAMVRIHGELKRLGLESRMILQVHDELVFEVTSAELDQVRDLVQTEMVNALPLKVPIEIDIGVGDNWLEAH